MDKPTATQKDQELSVLTQTILKHVFSNEPLPGSTTPVSFPDLAFLLTQPDLYLLDETVKGPIYIAALDKSVQVVSLDFLRQIAGLRGKVMYCQFSVTQPAPDRVLVRLEAKVLSPDADYRTATLSSLQLEFEKINREWVLLNTPTALSA